MASRNNHGRIPAKHLAYQGWYKTARWQRLRAAFLADNPICVMCLPRVTEATICDHITPHKGDETLFWSGPFQALCKRCHDSDKKRIETGNIKKRIGIDGWPIE